jgi:cold shock CspA family protein
MKMDNSKIGVIDWYDARKGLGEIVSGGIKYFVKSEYLEKSPWIPVAGHDVVFEAVMENEHWQAKNARRIL